MKQIRRTGLRRLGGATRAQEQEDAPKAARSTLLYVEDNRDNWEVAQLMLRRRFALKWAQTDVQGTENLQREDYLRTFITGLLKEGAAPKAVSAAPATK